MNFKTNGNNEGKLLFEIDVSMAMNWKNNCPLENDAIVNNFISINIYY